MAETQRLILLNYDGIAAYMETIGKVTIRSVQLQFEKFKADHERHAKDLLDAVSHLVGVPAGQPDLAGFVTQGFAANGSDVSGALRAMQSNEIAANKAYGDVLGIEMPAAIRKIVKQHYEDERRHLAWIQEQLVPNI